MTRRRGPGRVFDEPDNLAPPFPDARNIVADETDPVEAAVAAGTQEGFQQGWQRAAEKFEQEVTSFREQMADSLKRLAELEQELTRQHESQLLQITVEAASRIVRERVDENDPVAARALNEALDTLPNDVAVKVRLNPDDVSATGERLAAEIQSGRIELIADPSVSRGGCAVESPVGTVDATLETALAGVRDGALGVEQS